MIPTSLCRLQLHSVAEKSDMLTLELTRKSATAVGTVIVAAIGTGSVAPRVCDVVNGW